MTGYAVQGESFPGTLKGLTAAIKYAALCATLAPVDVIKIIDGQEAVIRTVPVQPAKPGLSARSRYGHFPQDAS